VKTRFPYLPVVAFTGLEDEQVGLQLIQAGAQDYLVKSQVTSGLLCRAIRYALERKRAVQERERLIGQLQQAVAEVDMLSGLLPICSACKKIRNDKGYWSQIETYIMQHSRAQFTHGLCPDCIRKYNLPRAVGARVLSMPLPDISSLINQGREPGDHISILIVEDEPGDAYLAVNALKTARISNAIYVVEDGVEALSFLRREGQYKDVPRPGLILLDLNLPRKDGREVLATIRAAPELASIPIVIMTTSKAEEEMVKPLVSQATSFMAKPIEPSQFYAVVQSNQSFWLSLVQLPPSGSPQPPGGSK
jgi:CheY-like chemotaxis protein